MVEEKLLTRKQAAEYLGLKPDTLAGWHSKGMYSLPLVKVGNAVRYRLSDLEEWLSRRTICSADGRTSERPQATPTSKEAS